MVASEPQSGWSVARDWIRSIVCLSALVFVIWIVPGHWWLAVGRCLGLVAVGRLDYAHTVRIGMTEEELVAQIGKPNESVLIDGNKTLTFDGMLEEHDRMMVLFREGRVFMYVVGRQGSLADAAAGPR